jgi:hypothetical protein
MIETLKNDIGYIIWCEMDLMDMLESKELSSKDIKRIQSILNKIMNERVNLQGILREQERNPNKIILPKKQTDDWSWE